jgi:hypothetical protein
VRYYRNLDIPGWLWKTKGMRAMRAMRVMRVARELADGFCLDKQTHVIYVKAIKA